MNISKILKPNNIAEAYVNYSKYQGSILMAGGVFLKLQKKTVPLAIDLSDLGLDYIQKTGDVTRIGAMTTLRAIENCDDLPMALQLSVRQIGGVGLRNVATLGGSICGHYPFSDVTTALLSLDAQLVFYKAGMISLHAYLEGAYQEKDILKEIIVPNVSCSNFKSFKMVYTDFSLVNVSVSYKEGWRISIGSRPGGPILLKQNKISYNSILNVLETVSFGDDHRASGKYRKALAEVLINDAISEVSHGNND